MSSTARRRLSPTLLAVLIGVGPLAGCGDGVPYTSVADVPGLSGWRQIYEYRNTAGNGGCEDGKDCRAYAVLETPRGMAPSDAARKLVAGLLRQGWSCASADTPRQGALRSADGRRFVEFEPVGDLADEDELGRGFFDDSHGLLAAVGAAVSAGRDAVAIVAARSTSPEFRSERIPDTGLCAAVVRG